MKLAVFKYRPHAIGPRELELCARFDNLGAAERFFDAVSIDPEIEVLVLMDIGICDIIGIRSNGRFRING